MSHTISSRRLPLVVAAGLSTLALITFYQAPCFNTTDQYASNLSFTMTNDKSLASKKKNTSSTKSSASSARSPIKLRTDRKQKQQYDPSASDKHPRKKQKTSSSPKMDNLVDDEDLGLDATIPVQEGDDLSESEKSDMKDASSGNESESTATEDNNFDLGPSDESSDESSDDDSFQEPMKAANAKTTSAPKANAKAPSPPKTPTSPVAKPTKKLPSKPKSSKQPKQPTQQPTSFDMPKWLLDEMLLPSTKHTYFLNVEGITSPSDLIDLDKEALDAVFYNCTKSKIGAIGVMIQKRFHVARTAATLLHKSLGRPLNHTTMSWTHCLSDFAEEWQSISKRVKAESTDFPKLGSSTEPNVYIEAVQLWCSNKFGQGNIPLAYLIRENENPGSPPPLAPWKCHSDEFESLEEELIAYAPHSGVTFREDNKALAKVLEESIRGTVYYATVKTHLKKGKGKEAWSTLQAHLAGKIYWEDRIRKSRDFLQQKKWSHGSKQSIKTFITKFTTAYETMKECKAAGHSVAIPDQAELVRLFLEAIKVGGDPLLAAAISTIRQNLKGELNDFKLASTHILDNVVDKKVDRKSDDPSATISSLRNNKEKEDSGRKARRERKKGKGAAHSYVGSDLKKGIGKTGVHLRWHTPAEAKALTPAQYQELKGYFNRCASHHHDLSKKNKKLEASVAALQGATSPTVEAATNKDAPAPATIAQVASALASLTTVVQAMQTEESSTTPRKRKKARVSSTAVQAAGEEDADDEDDDDSYCSPSEEDEIEEDDPSDSDDASVCSAAERAMQKLIPQTPGLAKKNRPSTASQSKKRKRWYNSKPSKSS